MCPLCHSTASPFANHGIRNFYQCSHCKGIFVHPSQLPDSKREMERYLYHRNDVGDKGYREFVTPMVNAVLNGHSPNETGLDFGAGPSSAVSAMLREHGFCIEEYDPFFKNNPLLLSKTYHYITCCEVVEHFHNPRKEFELLRSMLKPGGSLYCMTSIYEPTIDFTKWYYKNDFTHVFFYQQQTLEYIKAEFGFVKLSVQKNLITFSV